jgi:sRNA-binding regulator protein Hfq
MSESIEDSNKEEYTGPHGNGTEKSVSRLEGFRYQTIYTNSIDNLGKHLLGRILSFELTNNKVVTGRMKSFGQYDLIVSDSKTGQDVLVMKTAIVTVQGDLSPKKGSI